MSGPDPQVRTIGRVGLGAVLMLAGTGHLTFQRKEFQAQVPDWFPADKDVVVLASGVVEVLLGLALIAAGRRRAPLVGVIAGGFFIAVFPGNVGQLLEGNDAFGLDTTAKRVIRLFFQPVLVVWALRSTGGWELLRTRLGWPARSSG
jgi:uncharacterized membrane protein